MWLGWNPSTKVTIGTKSLKETVPTKFSGRISIFLFLTTVKQTMPRGTTIRIDTEQDRFPERTILDLFKANAGRSILIRVYRKGCVRRRGRIVENPQTQYIFFQEAYDVPSTNREINQMFNGRQFEGRVRGKGGPAHCGCGHGGGLGRG